MKVDEQAEKLLRRRPARVVGIGLLALGIVVASVAWPFELDRAALVRWTQGLGAWGYVVFVAGYAAATVLLIPGSLLTLAAGFLFGVVGGTIAVSAGSTLGAAAAFGVGRHFARAAVQAKVAERPMFAAIDRAVAREGFKIVLLTRLSPVFPFNLLNYAYGLTGVTFRAYVLASWIGMLPGTILYVYVGATAKDLTQLLAGDVPVGPGHQVLKIAGLLATVMVTVYVTRVARVALERSVQTESASAPR